MSTLDLDAIEARADAAMHYPGMVTIDQSQADVPALLALVREQQAALWRVERLAARWATLAEGDRYYAKHIRTALDES